MPLKKLILFGILSYSLISANIGGYSVYILDEAKNAECAREMLTSGNFIIPVFNGELRTDKPPLHYYFMMAAYGIFGETPFAARFFSVIFGVLTVLMTYLFALRFVNEATANYAVLTLISSLAFIIQFHLATPDPYLIFFMTASLFSYFYFDQTKKTKFLYLAYLAVGLGTLTKGPVAIALPGISIFLYLLTCGKLHWAEIRKLKPITGMLIVILTAAPWYLLVHLKTEGAWTTGFFIDHNINRFAEAREGHGGSFFLPALFLLGILLPFSVLIPQVIGKVRENRKSNVLLFCAIVIVTILIFFSFSGTKLPNYVSPVFPFAALLIGFFLNEVGNANKKVLFLSLLLFLLIGIGSWWGAIAMLSQNKALTGLDHLSAYFLILPFSGIIGLIFLYFKEKAKAVISISFGFIVFHQCFFYFIYPKIDAQNPVTTTLAMVQEAENIISYKQLNPAFIFAIKEIIPETDELSEIVDFLHTSKKALIISHPKYEKELTQIKDLEVLALKHDLFDTNDVLLLKYQAQASPSP